MLVTQVLMVSAVPEVLPVVRVIKVQPVMLVTQALMAQVETLAQQA
jgi:hypothetical protein